MDQEKEKVKGKEEQEEKVTYRMTLTHRDVKGVEGGIR